MNEDLDFIETEVLLMSLFKRFDAAVFMGHKSRSDEEAELMFEPHGDFPTCYGLAQMAVDHMQRNSPDDCPPSV